MIKKFNEFIEEHLKLDNLLTKEEVEDQFLRLKEVFNCKIVIDYPPEIRDGINIRYKWYVIVFGQGDNLQEISKELKRIKTRIENMFPVSLYIGKMQNSKSPFVEDIDYISKGNFFINISIRLK